MPVDHPTFGTFCCICFSGLTPEQCAEDTEGQKWDVCRGQCAREAGIQEGRGDETVGAADRPR